MLLFLILENWKEYDHQKILANEDPRTFNASNEWEVDYLAKKVGVVFDQTSRSAIRDAIHQLTQSGSSLFPRRVFVNRVIERLCLFISSGSMVQA